METYNATKLSDNLIELTNSNDLEKLYKTIDEENNFIIKWIEGNVTQSKVMISNNLKAKVLNEEIILSAKQGGEQKK